MARYTTIEKVRVAPDIPASVPDAEINTAISIAEEQIDLATSTSWTHVTREIEWTGDGSSEWITSVLYIREVLALTADGVAEDFSGVKVLFGGILEGFWRNGVSYTASVRSGITTSPPPDIVQAATVEAQIRVRDSLRQSASYQSSAQISNEFGSVIPLRPGGKYGFSASPLVNAIIDTRRQK